MSTSVFISKSLHDVADLALFLEKRGIELIAHSFLTFEAVASNLPEKFDCIFFGSPRSVRFFLSNHSTPEGIRFACAGQKTAETLSELGHTPDFIASQSGNIDASSRAFGKWCGDATVLFPLSETSNKSYTKHLDSRKVLEMVVYRTRISSLKLPVCTIYIFTSPSNVTGFLNENTLRPESKVIAWGQTTAEALESRHLPCDHVLSNSSEQDLINTLNTHFLCV